MQQPVVFTDLASLIGSRICHDLISPIGAINNGLELLVISGEADGPEMALIGESVGSASARIRFFRIAFGAAGEQMVGSAEVAAILRDLYANSRLDIHWAVDTPQSRALVRISFLAMMCLETAMPYGGSIKLRESADGWTLVGHADRINAKPALWDLLTGEGTDASLQPAHVQFALLPLVAHEHGRMLQINLDETRVQIRF
jgi:histidine phosphotransferase ChpT